MLVLHAGGAYAPSLIAIKGHAKTDTRKTILRTLPMRFEPLDESTLPTWSAMRNDFWGDDDATVQAAFARYKLRNRAGTAMTFFGVAEDGRYIGFLDAELRTDYVEGAGTSPVWFVEGVYVVPDKRRSGVGAHLIAHLEGHARDQGYSEIASDCELTDSRSEAFHKTAGFQEVIRSIHLIKCLS